MVDGLSLGTPIKKTVTGLVMTGLKNGLCSSLRMKGLLMDIGNSP